MKDWKKIGVFVLIVAAVSVIDHAGKLIAAYGLADGARYSYLGIFCAWRRSHNTGAILGLGSQLPEAIRTWMMPAVTAGGSGLGERAC